MTAAPPEAATGGAGGDWVGAALVRALVERAEVLPASARVRLLARAATLSEHYRARTSTEIPAPPARYDDTADGFREVLESRARARAPRIQRARATTSFVAELRATSATARAAEQVPSSAGPYHGAAVASRALGELLLVAPAYVNGYVEWLDDLACLAETLERRAAPRK